MISRALIPTILAAGGRVLVNAPVKKLQLAAGNRVIGVELENGCAIFCPTVISAGGALATESIVHASSDSDTDTDTLSLLRPQHKCLDDGISHMYGFIGLEGTSGAGELGLGLGLGLRSSNLWVLPGTDIDAHCAAYYKDPFAEAEKGNLLMFMGFPSAKDPAFAAKFPGKSTCVIITEARTEWFSQFSDKTANAPSGKRNSPGYDDLKAKFKALLLSGLYEQFPQLEGKVKYCEIGTPLSNQFYLRRTASYGLTHQPCRYTAAGGLRPAQEHLPGLWLTGQDIATNGFAGAMMGGLLTAHGVLGYGLFDLLCCNTNLVTDMEKLLAAQTKQR